MHDLASTTPVEKALSQVLEAENDLREAQVRLQHAKSDLLCEIVERYGADPHLLSVNVSNLQRVLNRK